MTLAAVIASFSSGTYSVSRRAVDTHSEGVRTPGSASTFNIDASVQPLRGRDLVNLPEAQHGEDVMVLYTTTELRTRSGETPPDQVTIDSVAWDVVRVEKWPEAVHYKVHCARRPL